jgi:DNA-binding protein
LSEDIVYVGKEHPEHYVAKMRDMLDKGAEKIILRARGRAISRAVDVSQVASRTLGLRVGPIRIDTVRKRLRDGREIGLSVMEITMEQGMR